MQLLDYLNHVNCLFFKGLGELECNCRIVLVIRIDMDYQFYKSYVLNDFLLYFFDFQIHF